MTAIAAVLCVFVRSFIIAYCFDSDDFGHPVDLVLVMRPMNGNHADILEVVVQAYDRSSIKILHVSYHRGVNWLNVPRVTEPDSLTSVEYHSTVEVGVAALHTVIASSMQNLAAVRTAWAVADAA